MKEGRVKISKSARRMTVEYDKHTDDSPHYLLDLSGDDEDDSDDTADTYGRDEEEAEDSRSDTGENGNACIRPG